MWITDGARSRDRTSTHPGTHTYPKEGLGFIFDEPEHCPGGIGPMKSNWFREVNVFHNYVPTVKTVNSPCFTTADDTPNRLDQGGAESHRGVGNRRRRQQVHATCQRRRDVGTSPRGYWNLQHSQYNGSKACSGCPNQNTYHWHAVSFDGPVVPVDRSYQVPDALIPTCKGNNNACGMSLGYSPGCWGGVVACSDFTLPNVNLPGATKAYLTYNVWYTCATRERSS